ncbi:TPA: glycosyltransferase family 2 protein [Clostridium perfringens]|nr:glycosyltransferase family 2 protein [Clostridium perfringens]
MKISVIIPVYNAEKYIKKCLNSVIEQTYSDWEIIAIDDGSKDESYNIL